ncbi:MAG: glycosyltransferase family 2 protein [Verrucomicrobia bacterium]|nr:glycosyltransferase family 2 protein [Verrucomicrobiota bacterium]
MIKEDKVIVVMPAYNAEATLEKTVHGIDREVVDEIIVVDDHSHDRTVEVAHRLQLTVHQHDQNRGYGGNQKTCYHLAIEHGATIIVMVHPDYQYDPRLVPVMAHMIASGLYDAVLASRILGGSALKGGMPLYKYIGNRCLTGIENLLTGAKLSEYHTGYRSFRASVLQSIPFDQNSDNFIFDNQILCQLLAAGYRLGEVSCPTKYFPEASSISLIPSIRYGFGVLGTALLLALHRAGLWKSPLFRGCDPEKITAIDRQQNE